MSHWWSHLGIIRNWIVLHFFQQIFLFRALFYSGFDLSRRDWKPNLVRYDFNNLFRFWAADTYWGILRESVANVRKKPFILMFKPFAVSKRILRSKVYLKLPAYLGLTSRVDLRIWMSFRGNRSFMSSLWIIRRGVFYSLAVRYLFFPSENPSPGSRVCTGGTVPVKIMQMRRGFPSRS